MHISVQCNRCTVHYLSNKTEDYFTVTAVRVSYIVHTLGPNFTCVCVSIVLRMEKTCNAHVSKSQEIELSWKIFKAEGRMGGTNDC